MTPALALLAMACPGAAPEALERALAEWEVLEFVQDGEVRGVAIVKGTEFHFQTFPGFRPRRAQMREFLRPLLERHGYLTTRVAHDDLANQRFNRAFGFERTWSDGRFHYFLLDKLPFGKEGTCQL